MNVRVYCEGGSLRSQKRQWLSYSDTLRVPEKTLRRWRNSHQHPRTRPFNFAVVAFSLAHAYIVLGRAVTGWHKEWLWWAQQSWYSFVDVFTFCISTSKVTGANQGIGLEIVRQLCKKFEGKVLLSGTWLNHRFDCNLEVLSYIVVSVGHEYVYIRSLVLVVLLLDKLVTLML